VREKEVSVAQRLAEEVIGLDYRDLPPEVIHQTKRLVLDTLGCAVGGYSSKASRAIQELLGDLDGPREATLIGSGMKTSCLNAALANGLMVRCLDYNDAVVIESDETYRVGYHPSEVIPPVLALGEREHLTGKEAIATIVLGYDLSNRFLEGIVGPEMEQRGWNGDTRGAYIIPLLAGRILGLEEDQMRNALGISASCHAVLGILDAPAEEYTMAKNLRFPLMAYGGILAAMMAQKGFTGPARVIEGHDGFVETFLNGDYNLSKLTDSKRRFTIRDACIKSIIADYSAHGHLTATLTLVKQHDIKPEDVAEVRIRASTRCARHTGDPAKKYPKNRETADHSSYYLTAMAIIDGQVGPDQFSPEKYSDPKVLDLINKIKFEGDKRIDRMFLAAGTSEIVTKDGRKYECQVNYPKGHPQNPMTDGEVVDKFKSMAERYMRNNQMDRIVRTVFEMEELDDIGKLNCQMVFKRSKQEGFKGGIGHSKSC
jgi:2-methylcitrate dehydratase